MSSLGSDFILNINPKTFFFLLIEKKKQGLTGGGGTSFFFFTPKTSYFSLVEENDKIRLISKDKNEKKKPKQNGFSPKLTILKATQC